jgi:uncharacterized protein DUF3606
VRSAAAASGGFPKVDFALVERLRRQPTTQAPCTDIPLSQSARRERSGKPNASVVATSVVTEVRQMVDEETQHPLEIDVNDEDAVRYWCERWSVSEAELHEAVKKVGTAVPAVAFALGKEAY